MGEDKIKKPQIEIISVDETQVTYKKIVSKKIFSKRSPLKKNETHTDNEVTLLLFDENLIDRIQEALEKIILERKNLENAKKRPALERISNFLLK